MNKRLSRSDAGKLREAGKRAGVEYCILSQRNRKARLPDCRKCKLAGNGRDCFQNPIGYRDLVVGRGEADWWHHHTTGQTMINLPSGIGNERNKTA